MDKISEAFETLKGLLANKNSGACWGGTGAKRKLVEPKPMQAVQINHGYTLGATNQEVIEAGEELRLHALGLQYHPRLKRRNMFICSIQAVSGARLELNQILMTDRSIEHLRGSRCLLAIGGEHVGRKVELLWKVADGLGCDIIRASKRKHTIADHGATFVVLDRVPEPFATGYPILSFR